MNALEVPGARLSYEVSGSGPLMILVPRAVGVAEVFLPLARLLSVQNQVVTYDRRGFFLEARLTGLRTITTDSLPIPMLSGARPSHLTDQPATVFGNSSGAIVALEVLTQSPERVQTVVAHEPPVVFLLPDAAKWLAFFERVYDTYRKDGIPKAMHQFASGTVGSVDHQVIEHAMREHANEYTRANAACLHSRRICFFALEQGLCQRFGSRRQFVSI